jgi:hypothetical protein
VKTPILLAAALVGSLAVVARSVEETPAESGRPAVANANVRPAAAPEEGGRPAAPFASEELRAVAPPIAPSPALLMPEHQEVQAPSPRSLAGKLERELGLSALQRERVEEIFRDRELQVAAIQRQVLEAGVFDPRTTDPQLARSREESYRRISMLLDDAQNRRFAEILAGNLINDHQVLVLPDSLVVLD